MLGFPSRCGWTAILSIMISSSQRQRFDEVLDAVIAELPEHLHDLLEEVPLIVEDEPTRDLLVDVGLDPDHETLLGLHSGVALTERSVEAPAGGSGVPDHMMVFRGPILRSVGHSQNELERQVRITVLHEIGHHFGLDEDDLDALGYG